MYQFQNMKYNFINLKQCVVCNSNKLIPFFYDKRQNIDLSFMKCEKCNALIQNPRFDDKSLKDYFCSSDFFGSKNTEPTSDTLGYYNYSDWEQCYKKNAGPILNKIKKFIKPPAKLLEIGSATGWFLFQSQKYGYDAIGLDISKPLAESVKIKYNIDVKVNSIENCDFSDSSFDIICNFGGIACWANPIIAMKNINRILKQDGLFCFNYTDYNNIIAKLSGKKYFEFNHASMVIYTQSSMHYLLKENGFKILTESTHWQYASIKRILTYLKFFSISNLFEKIYLSKMILKIPVIGTNLVFCKRL